MPSEGLNKVMLIGNLGMDPELKFGQSGVGVLRLRMATTERYMTRGGERQERTEWHTVIFFGKRAEGLSKVLSKGAGIYIEGRLQTRQWEDRDGNKRYTTEVVGTQLLFLGGRRDSEGGGYGGDGGGGYGGHSGGGSSGSSGSGSSGSGSSGSGSSGDSKNDFPADDFGDDDIPF